MDSSGTQSDLLKYTQNRTYSKQSMYRSKTAKNLVNFEVETKNHATERLLSNKENSPCLNLSVDGTPSDNKNGGSRRRARDKSSLNANDSLPVSHDTEVEPTNKIEVFERPRPPTLQATFASVVPS